MEQSQRNEHLHACARTFNMFSINRWRLLCYKCYNFPLFCEPAELLSHVSLKEARLHYTLPTSSSAWWLPHRHPEAQTCAVFTYSPPYPFTLSLPLIMAINNDDNVPFFFIFFLPLWLCDARMLLKCVLVMTVHSSVEIVLSMVSKLTFTRKPWENVLFLQELVHLSWQFRWNKSILNSKWNSWTF